MPQVKNSFDKETLKKIGKGALYALSSPIALQIADYAKESGMPLWIKIVVWGVPVGFNAVKEFIKGQPKEKVLNE